MRLARFGAALLLTLVAIAPTGAWANSRHEYSGSIELGGGALAVDEQRSLIYKQEVLEQAGEVRIKKFNTNGEPSNFTGTAPYITGNELKVATSFPPRTLNGIAVDPATGRIYVKNRNKIEAFEASGEPAQFSALGSNEITVTSADLCGIAVDVNSDIYAADCENHVDIYSSSGELISSQNVNVGNQLKYGTAAIDDLAVDVHGALYVSISGANGRPIDKLTPSAALPVTPSTTYHSAGTIMIREANGWGIVTDPQNGDVYVDGGTVVRRFDEAGSLVESFGETGPGALFQSEGLALRDGPEGAIVYASGDVFVPSPVPDVTTGGAREVLETAATVQGSVNSKGLETTYQFAYGTTTAYGSVSPLPPSPAGSGKEDVAVSAELSGLAPDTTYHYRLTATNEKGTTVGHDRTFSTIAPPGISQLAVADVGSSSAALQAIINPHHSATAYRFEYGSTEAYGRSLPVPDGEAGSDDLGHQVAVHLTGLQPGATYHWRVVASNAASPGGTASEDRTFTTFAGSSGSGGRALPDGRAWEMVSPPDKNGADLGNFTGTEWILPGLYDKQVRVTGLYLQSSSDGNGVMFASSLAAFAEPQSAMPGNAYLSRRGAGGWSTRSLNPPSVLSGPSNGLLQPAFFAFSLGLAKSVYFQPQNYAPLTTEAPEDVADYYVGQTGDGSYQYMGSSVENFGNLEGMSEDFKHVLVGIPNVFVGIPDYVCFEFYLDGEGKTQQRPVTVLPNGTPVSGACGAGGESHYPHEHDISPDGSRIVFTTGGVACKSTPGSALFGGLSVIDFNICGEHPDIYLRENGTTSRLLSAYAPGAAVDAGAGPSQVFQGANRQVTRVFFTSQTRLTAESTAGHSPGNGTTTGSLGDLYRYDTEAGGGAGELQDLSVDNVSPEGAQVLGVLGNSDDGSKVYFVARSDQLTGQGVPGQANLYEWDENGGSPTTTYIATLQPVGTGDGSGDSADWMGDVFSRSSEVTPDGEHVLFTSKNRLTAFDNAGRDEVYVYDASSHQLMCASCAGDQPPAGDSFPPFTYLLTASRTSHPHAISADGRYVFFSSSAALVPADTNGKFDAYEYDTQTHEISLLSTGRSSSDSWFLGASPSGQDAFFLTRSKLVAADTDGNLDLYDARVGGGIAAQNEVATVPTCQGDSCQPLPSAPNDPTPASSGFEGPGNATVAAPALKKQTVKKPAKKRRRPRRAVHRSARRGRHARKANVNHHRRHG